MYKIEKTITESPYKGLKAIKLKNIDAKEIRLITMEENQELPEHSSPRDVLLIMLEGTLDFFIGDKSYRLEKHEIFDFRKNLSHKAKAVKDAKFLIIR